MIILGYLAGPTVIRRSLQKGGWKVELKRRYDGNRGQGEASARKDSRVKECGQPLEAGKGEEVVPPLEPLEEIELC